MPGNPTSLRAGGIVLAGGRSTRMGRPKACLPVAGTTLLDRTVATVAAGLRLAAGRQGDGGSTCTTAPVVVVAAADQELPPLEPQVMVTRDRVAARGPLQGMEAGLACLEGRADAAFVSSCDTPLLRPAFVAGMLARLGDHDIIVPRTDGRHHPLAAVYRVALLPLVRELLAADRRRPFFLFEQARTRVIEADALAGIDTGLDSLRNVNTPEDYRDILQRIDGERAGAPVTDCAASSASARPAAASSPGPAPRKSDTEVVFELFGVARHRAGRDEVSVTASTLGDALAALEDACPELAATLVSGGRLTYYALLSVNGNGFASNPATPLRPGDRLILMSASAGG